MNIITSIKDCFVFAFRIYIWHCFKLKATIFSSKIKNTKEIILMNKILKIKQQYLTEDKRITSRIRHNIR